MQRHIAVPTLTPPAIVRAPPTDDELASVVEVICDGPPIQTLLAIDAPPLTVSAPPIEDELESIVDCSVVESPTSEQKKEHTCY